VFDALGAGAALGRGFAARNPAVWTLAPVFDALGVRAGDTAVVCATFSAMSAAQRAGAHAIGVERIREPRKVLHGGEGRNAVVRSLPALAEAMRECGAPAEMVKPGGVSIHRASVCRPIAHAGDV
jgi:hypothetical protein